MPERILIAEPERHIARLIEVNLERAGYLVIAVAASVEDVHSLARTEKPDLIIISERMPDLASRLQADPQTAHIRALTLPVRPSWDWPGFDFLR